jgi:hypothetical protein
MYSQVVCKLFNIFACNLVSTINVFVYTIVWLFETIMWFAKIFFLKDMITNLNNTFFTQEI